MSFNKEYSDDNNINFDDFSRQPERFGENKESTDKIIFPDEFERMKINEKDKQTCSTNYGRDEKNKEIDSRIVFPDDKLCEENEVSEENTCAGNSGNFEEYIRQPEKFGNNAENVETDDSVIFSENRIDSNSDLNIRMSEDTEKEEC